MERAFRIFDCDGNGTVSMAEFIDTMHKFAGQSSDEKLVFLFRVYDLDGKYTITSIYAVLPFQVDSRIWVRVN